MFDIGFLEISVVFVVALIVVGPEKLPGLARTVGLYVGKARRYADFVRREIENEVRSAELKELAKKPAVLDEVKESLSETADALKSTEQELKQFAAPVSEESAPVSEVTPEKPQQTLGDMARASWSDSSATEVAEQKSAEPESVGPAPEDSVEGNSESSTDPSPEFTDGDERREQTT